MTAQDVAAAVAGPNETQVLPTRPPLSRAAQLAVAASLILAGFLNGGTQFVGHLVIDDGGDFGFRIPHRLAGFFGNQPRQILLIR